MKAEDLEDRLINFAVRVVNVVEEMISEEPASDTGNSARHSYFANQQSSVDNHQSITQP